ncbi:MAG: hypothetical protein ABUL77_04120 [Bacteroidota bacterium]
MRNVRNVIRASALALLLVIATTSAASAAITDDDLYGAPRAPLGLTVALGMRSDLVRSPGLDAFSTTDGLPQSSLSLAYHRGADDRSGLAVGFEWNHGSTMARARDADASLTVDRFTLSLEGRIPVAARLSAFGRVAPGLLRDGARMVDPSVAGGPYGAGAGGVREQSKTVAAVDASAGLAFRFAEVRGRGTPRVGFWLTGEGGYGYAGAHDLVLASGTETQPGRVDQPLRLGELSLRGAFLRARFAVSF